MSLICGDPTSRISLKDTPLLLMIISRVREIIRVHIDFAKSLLASINFLLLDWISFGSSRFVAEGFKRRWRPTLAK